ncbi:MAG: tetratricopeptide repeat protein [Candidatus Krumholzibacteria bacterium]|nr:tetratricopeptide repeat protein [Candidatus Krumholzibacteria bacterium]
MPEFPPAAEATIAVLPFATITGDETQAYFAEGIAEDVADRLAGIPGVRVAPFASTLALSGGAETPADIGRRLAATGVLTGTCERSTTTARATVALLDPATNTPRWSAQYDRPLTDVFAIQIEIVRAVCDACGVEIADVARTAVERCPTANGVAYDTYLQGRRPARELLRQQQDLARTSFEQAVAADARFAEAHAALAVTCGLLFQYWDSSRANVAAATAASQTAVELAPQLPAAHIARGLALAHAGEYDAATTALQRALALRPYCFDAYYHLARTYRARGQMEEAAAAFERACALRSEDFATPTLLASVYVSLGRSDDARNTQQRALALAEEHLGRHPDDTRALYLGAVALSSLGDAARARQWAKRAIAMEPDDSAVLYNVACVYALLGLSDSAIDCLEQAVASGFGHWDWLRTDSDLDGLRSHERFATLLRGGGP